jgi:hypothetical protein
VAAEGRACVSLPGGSGVTSGLMFAPFSEEVVAAP